ncbi:alkaline phosphatase [Wenzhouxiangella sediminis]|uniref:Alkaline phosphatase n=1 Tax=Wenzhouxiangella sediminis TaxID=1792836 RepID=A0A3E1K6D3_9GAMM|nr:alkaline phosphatase [Wenzhouxiangella sediminis]RFF29528.1 alkaline phosphatase [Wenzhouxiangella sediminis]
MKPDTDALAIVRILAAGLVLNALLVLPAWWRDGIIGSVWFAPEALLLPAWVAVASGRRRSALLRAASGGLLAFVIVAGFFDALVQSVLGRPLNVFVDPLMLRAGFHLVDGSFGRWQATLASVLLAVAVIALAWVIFRLLRPQALPPGKAAPAIILASLLLGLPWVAAKLPVIESQAWRLLVTQAASLEATRDARARILAAADAPEFEPGPLPGLAGRDVYVVFIESYGGSALDRARMAGRVEPLLRRWTERLGAAGVEAVSGRMKAPIRGGQSWLSHASLLSGLSIDSQVWYEMLLEKDIGLLSDDFRQTGHVAVNVAPGIVMDWPEGDRLGFDRIYAAADLGYEGPPLGWVTMPDEYTLHTFSERIRPQQDGPVFAQIALISSHWPWRPVIEPLDDHSRIGHGRVYSSSIDEGERPATLLFDPDRMRRAYVRSLAYSLAVTFDWARRNLPSEALLIVLGDHQPVSLVTGREAGSEVPVHVISGDRDLLAGFIERGFVPGLLPVNVDEAPPITRLRHWLRSDFATAEHLP